MTAVIVGVVALIAGAAAGFLIRTNMARSSATTLEGQAQRKVVQADQKLVAAQEDAAQTLRKAIDDAKVDASQIRRDAEEDVKARRDEIARLERRVSETEDELRTRTRKLDERVLELTERDEKLQEVRARLEKAAEQHRVQLERVAGMTSSEAREQLVASLIDDAKRASMAQVREIEQIAREEGEGRDIRAFEATTGVNLIIDDTPEAVVLSSFDPVRREAARLSLEKLVQDGRIHPARIEEVHERSLAEIDERIRRAGEDAVAEVGITDIHPEMIKLLGRLQYRTSYGQNVLKHLVESAHIASALSAELGLDPTIAKRGAFLHDIGKAVTHEVEGSHAIIGAAIARRMKEDPEVVHCIESHHGEVEQRTIHAVLAQIADGISGGRPSARRESLETYVKRLERLEEICNSFPGVEKVYAMQAGREVRVLVQPESIDDLAAQVIARDIAKQVEEELQYPGQIKITVVREIGRASCRD